MSGLSSCEERDVRFELRNQSAMSGLSSGTRAQTGHGDVRFEVSQLHVRFELRGKVLKPDIPELKPDDLEPDITMSGLSSSAAGTSGLSSELNIFLPKRSE